ncbi:alpha/beta-hydrolase [Peniophora sp. CONT]|nr:alpha/beta-hydrolase [Peniophora sp. CONT]
MHELIDLKTEHENGTLKEAIGKEKVLWICANRYARKRGSVVGKGKTMICTHANGMHKELFEPLLHRLFALRDDVDEVWALDCVQHGDSALLNESADLGSLFDWSDLTRDVLCFLQHFLPQESCMPLPTFLERLPTSLAQSRLAEGLASRTLLALGHSYGGTALVLAVRACPVLFSALVLADPVILPPPPALQQKTYDFLRAFIPSAVVRRNSWASRQAALSAFKTSFMGAWPDEVLRLHVQHGLVETPAGNVRLKCSSFQEAVVYIEHYGVHEAWSALPDIDERVAVHWIVPSAGQSIVQTEDVAAERVRRRLANTSHVVLPGATHLLIQSHPLEVAGEIHRFMEAWSGNGPHSKARL